MTGRGRIASFQSGALRIAIPAIARLALDAPQLRCELVAAEPEEALPALALGDIDLVIGDEWQHAPWRVPAGLDRHELLIDPVLLVLPADHPAARRRGRAVGLAELADATWITGPRGLGWNDITERLCLEAGFAPSIRHRANDAVVAAALVASVRGAALLPRLALPDGDPRIAVRRARDLRGDAHRRREAPVHASPPGRRSRRRGRSEAALVPRPQNRSGLTFRPRQHYRDAPRSQPVGTRAHLSACSYRRAGRKPRPRFGSTPGRTASRGGTTAMSRLRSPAPPDLRRVGTEPP